MNGDADRVARKLLKLSEGLGDASRQGVNAAASKLVLPALQAEVSAALGGDGLMSGLGRFRAKGRPGNNPVVATFRPATSKVDSTAYVGPWGKGMAGAFGILEGGTQPHVAGGKASTRIARQGRRRDGTVTYNRIRNPRQTGRYLMNTPYGPRWGPFMVGGSPAKQPVSKTVRRVQRLVPKIVQAETSKAIVKAGFRAGTGG